MAKREVSEEDYDQLSDIQHIYELPDMVLSSDEFCKRIVSGYNFETNQIEKMETSIPPAVAQLATECLMNAADHIERSRLDSYPERSDDKPYVEVTMDKNTITVRNYGQAMPIGVHKKFGVPTPQALFGNLRSSSNYKPGKVRTGIGRNGYGVKATNIFSDPFCIDIANDVKGKRYQQEWRNKMGEYTEPEITSYSGDSYVQISYTLDFKRFKIDKKEGYTPEFFSMVAFQTLTISFTHKVVTSFNGVIFNAKHILDIGSLMYPPQVLETAFIHYQINPETEKITNINGRPTPVPKRGNEHVVVPVVEVLLVDSSIDEKDEAGFITSFVNGMCTDDGGVHVITLLKQVTPRIVKRINSTDKPDKKGGKVKNDKTNKIKGSDVNPAIEGILAIRVDNPKFDGQIKSRLKSPVPKIVIPEEDLAPIFRWGIIKRLEAILKAIESISLTKLDGKKTGFVDVESGFDANLAGTKDSHLCTLVLTEGESPLGYLITMLSFIEKGRNFYGGYPLRGKLLNTRKASMKRLLRSREIRDIKRYLGLKEGETDISNLRYGRVMIMTDADADGSHITGLIGNLFEHLYPDLVKTGLINNYRTKYLRAIKGKLIKDFYTESEFVEWKTNTPDWRKWKIAYYKGLGTSEDDEIECDAKKPKIIEMTCDDIDSANFARLFGKGRADDRKRWLEEVRDLRDQPFILSNSMSFTNFFNREFSNFAVMSLERAIPLMSDTLKHCYRQILWGVMEHFRGKGPYTKIKVAQLANKIAELVSYRHGEGALAEAIIHMAMNYMGSNNLPLLVPRGQFGTRFAGGKDHASPRYVNTEPSKWLYLIFRREDIPILERIDDEGKEVEPRTLLPIIPIGLVNGCAGVGLGHSTSIPNFSPRDITDYIIWWLKKNYKLGKVNKSTPELVPSYTGFKGTIILHKDTPYDDESEMFMCEGSQLFEEDKEDDYDDEMLELDEELPEISDEEKSRKADSISFLGTYEVDEKKDLIRVTELPPGRWTINYYRWLQSMQKKKLIKSFKDHSTKWDVLFEIKGMSKPDHRKLNLVKRIRLSNMVLLDKDNIPTKYRNIQEYLDTFCSFRLEMYEKRRISHISMLKVKEKMYQDRIRIIVAIDEGKLVVTKRKKVDIKADITAMGIDSKVYEDMKLDELAMDGIDKIETEIAKLVNERNHYENSSAPSIWKTELMELARELRKEPALDRMHEIEISYGRPRK